MELFSEKKRLASFNLSGTYQGEPNTLAVLHLDNRLYILKLVLTSLVWFKDPFKLAIGSTWSITYNFVFHSNQVFGGSVYQKVNPKLETGINLGWTSTKSETSFGIGAKYELDKQTSVRAKVNNSSQIGLGYQQKLRDGKPDRLLQKLFILADLLLSLSC